MNQILLHLLGDYLTQSHWMATRKTKCSLVALIHASLYALPFLLIASRSATLVIWGTHFLIDRFRLARYLVFAKNQLSPRDSAPRWLDASATGYPSDCPAWLSVVLLIAADNTMHIAINYAAIQWIR